MPELTSPIASSSGVRRRAPRRSAPAGPRRREGAPVRGRVGGLEREHGRGSACGAMRLDERRDRLRRSSRGVAVEDEDVPVEVAERLAGCADGVAGTARLVLHRDLDAVVELARRRRCDDDDPLAPAPRAASSDPVDHPPPQQRVEVLRRRALHARADPSGHHNCCELVRHVSEKWLGRQDSNLGSRDQNPLPYRLATPQGEPHFTGARAEGGRAR